MILLKQTRILTVIAWADRRLEAGEITAEQHKFVTNIGDTHAAIPKALYKTHKVDGEGNMLDPIPVRNLTVGIGTPVHAQSKLCQIGIEHLTSRQELPRRNKSTREVLERIVEFNENNFPLENTAELVFPDIEKMYPNVDKDQGLGSIERRLYTNPSPSVSMSPHYTVEGLRICLECNTVKFKQKFYRPCRGVAMGSCHSCDFSDIWVGDLTQKHIDTCPVETLKFSIYRDDGFDILRNGARDIRAYEEHLNNLHPNIRFEIRHGKEGEHLDLWIMLKEDKIEWKCYMKTPPVYVGPTSCHDPVVKKAVFKGVGHRLRMNSSKVEYFDEAVDTCSKSFAIAGYDFQHARSELRKFRADDPVEMVRDGPKEKNTENETGVKIFYVDKYDPRMPHPRKIISRNYHHIENHPIVSKIFPRKNLIASCKRLPNLGEILSPTIQNTQPPVLDPGVGQGAAGGGVREERRNGSYFCEKYRKGSSCDVCKHMMRETSQVESVYFKKKFAIHGHLTHLKPSQKPKLRWFIYLMEDLGCQKQYVGSTTDICSRWASTKSACNKANSNSTGLYRHFQEGCASDTGDTKDHIRITLLDYLDTKEELLRQAEHEGGPQCRCTECGKLKRIEDKWIMRLGTFYGDSGLNSRDEIISSVRGNFKI